MVRRLRPLPLRPRVPPRLPLIFRGKDHYYEYPGAHSVKRHEGVSETRFKLIRFYGKDVPNGEEWEFFDLKNDPSEMKSQYQNPESASEIKRMKKELQRLRKNDKVPEEE